MTGSKGGHVQINVLYSQKGRNNNAFLFAPFKEIQVFVFLFDFHTSSRQTRN